MSLGAIVALAKAGSTLRAVAVAIVIVIVMGLLIAAQQIRVVSLQGAIALERDARQTAPKSTSDRLARR